MPQTWDGEGHVQEQALGACGTRIESENHINYLELLAAWLTLQCFCKDVSGKTIRFKIDNVAAVACINKKGSKKPHLNNLTRSIWLWCKDRNLYLSAVHLPGALNFEADHESRNINIDLEWMLKPGVFQKLSTQFGHVDIDLFACRINHQVDRYVSWKPDPSAFAIDAFFLDWSVFKAYAFPPFSLIGAVLKKVEEDQATLLLVAPMWLIQPWFTKLLRLLIVDPVILPKQCLSLPQDHLKVHLIKNLRMIGFLLSGRRSKQEEYHKRLKTLYCNHGENQQ